MYQGRCGVASECKREQEQHLHTLGKIRVHARGDLAEAVPLVVMRDDAQVIRDAVGTQLRRHGVDEIHHAEHGVKREEQFVCDGPCVGGRRRNLAISHSRGDGSDAKREKDSLASPVHCT